MIGGGPIGGAEIGGDFVLSYFPISDVSISGWTDQAGGTTNLFSVVDEVSFSDSDYVKSPLMDTGSDELTLAFGSISTPSDRTRHILRVRFRKQTTGSGKTINFTFQLRQGATLIASDQVLNIGTDWVTGELYLTGTEAAAITNYNDLRVRLLAEVA